MTGGERVVKIGDFLDHLIVGLRFSTRVIFSWSGYVEYKKYFCLKHPTNTCGYQDKVSPFTSLKLKQCRVIVLVTPPRRSTTNCYSATNSGNSESGTPSQGVLWTDSSQVKSNFQALW
ncbi:uncharacterized protein LOC111692207 [Anoplophora glabripennis]|uniref:uncharacterized protein LOC111692207 n=1 Tax=Anoplophora glabripennis TaxID=217634 RepID=UPI000C79189F|nr:uncharacterized protein LOC111692207 [Anoplophora glabripennis]